MPQTLRQNFNLYHAPQLFSNLYHRALPNSHPVTTSKTLLFGKRINKAQVRDALRIMELGALDEYNSFISGGKSPQLDAYPIEITAGIYYYDHKRNKTALRIKGIRRIRRRSEEPVEKTETETFVVDGKIPSAYPITNSFLGLTRYKNALRREGYDTGWTDWREFEIARDGEHVATATRGPSNSLLFKYGFEKPEIYTALDMARERGFSISES